MDAYQATTEDVADLTDMSYLKSASLFFSRSVRLFRISVTVFKLLQKIDIAYTCRECRRREMRSLTDRQQNIPDSLTSAAIKQLDKIIAIKLNCQIISLTVFQQPYKPMRNIVK